MPYIATKSRLIGGRTYQRGEVVDTSALTVSKLASLIRVGIIIQQDWADREGVVVLPVAEAAEVAEPEPELEATDICSVCGGGPYKRLDIHMRTHEIEEPE